MGEGHTIIYDCDDAEYRRARDDDSKRGWIMRFMGLPVPEQFLHDTSVVGIRLRVIESGGEIICREVLPVVWGKTPIPKSWSAANYG